jgi:carboxypeptidase C (cathepsin A)
MNLKSLIFLFFCCSCMSLFHLNAQENFLKTDMEVTTNHQVTIKGKIVPYAATVGTQPVWGEDGKEIAYLHYTYYKRSDVKSYDERPLLISFNGGPGSGSVWMHLAYTGPRILKIDDEGYPVQPYGFRENPHSVLDVTDIIYVNPVNTGYSRTIPLSGKEVDRSKFFGINADIKYLADWINTFVSRAGRWPSPKYLIGESYGGTRVAGLALELQNKQWMYLNGVIMVSPADYKVLRVDSPVSDALNIPYYAATAWYHKMLPTDLQSKDLDQVLPEVEKFAIDEVIPALAKGGFLGETEKNAMAKKMACYTGLSADHYLENNLTVSTSYFWKHLLKDTMGYNVGRLDSRYLGIDRKLSGNAPDYSAELTSWLHSFTPAINHYFRSELNLKTDVKYNMFGDVNPWNNENDNTRDNLRQAMAQNPYLKVMFQSGYYDGATTYFNAKYTMWQLDPSGRMKDRLSFKGYRSGHMMYLRREDLAKSTDDIREFIKNSLANGKPAKY